jgi:hypothetical protein
VLSDFASRDSIRGEIVLVVEGAGDALAAVAEAGAAAALAAAEPGCCGGGGGDASSDGGGGDGGGAAALGGAAAEAAAAAGAGAAAAAAAAAGDPSALRAMLADLLAGGASVSGASKQLSQQLGVGRSQVYKLALQVEAEQAKGRRR